MDKFYRIDRPSTMVVDKTGADTTEDGGQVTLDLRLSEAADSDVTVEFTINDDTEARVDVQTLSFTPQNCNGVESINITGVDEELPDGDQTHQLVFSELESDDLTYQGYLPEPVSLTTIDNDTAGVRVESESPQTGEDGGQAQLDVVLNAKPSADVTGSGRRLDGVLPGSLRRCHR